MLPLSRAGTIPHVPSKVEAGQTTQSLFSIFDAYYIEARRLQKAYEQSIHIFVGLEVDWIRPSSKQFIERLLVEHQFDLFIGSVHHVHAVPIDYDHVLYEKARALCGSTEESIFQAYFDAQLDMLQSLKPPVVGHFDLIRLKSDDPAGSFQRWESVWHKVLRNLEYIAGYGGILELNSAALRKGMSEPYPKAEICKVSLLYALKINTPNEGQAFLEKGGMFTLSDDSHGVDQVGYGYDKVLRFVEEVGITTLQVVERGATTKDTRFPGVASRVVHVRDLTAT